jgi:hypothetical protein
MVVLKFVIIQTIERYITEFIEVAKENRSKLRQLSVEEREEEEDWRFKTNPTTMGDKIQKTCKHHSNSNKG